MKKLFNGLTSNEKVSFVINGLTINGLVPTYAKTQDKYAYQARIRPDIWSIMTSRRVAKNWAAAGNQWESGSEAPSCRRLGVWGQTPSRRRHGPALENFAFFLRK